MTWTLHEGDALAVLRTLPAESVQTCVTSPPYFGLRDYGVDGQIGLEVTPAEYIEKLVEVFREVRRVLRDAGTLWLNLGDSYASTSKGSGGTGKSGLMRDGRAEPGRRSADAANGRAAFDTRRFDLDAAGVKPKDLLGIPWRVAFALQDAGWYLRADIIWHKPAVMPESVQDRPTKAHEYLFLLSKSARYLYDADAIREPAVQEPQRRGERSQYQALGQPAQFRQGDRYQREEGGVDSPDGKRNKRSVWTIPTQPFSGAHFAVMPPGLVEPCILAGCPVGGTVLDPFAGAGTVGLVARRLQRAFVGIELNPTYAAMARERIAADAPLFNRAEVA